MTSASAPALGQGLPPPRHHAAALALLLLLATTLSLSGQASPPLQWTATWGSSQLKSTETDSLPSKALEGATLRQVVHLSLGGDAFRLRLSNALGQTPLVLHSVQVAKPRAGAPGSVEPGSQRLVHFNGRASVFIPEGAESLSDPIPMTLPAFSDLTITMVIDSAPETLTFHAGSRATSFLLRGDHAADLHLESPQTFAHWYFIAAVDVASRTKTSAIVALGDSITDGRGSTTDANDRWTDVLAKRLAPAHIGVINAGIGGNRILQDILGPSALARFDRDVLAPAGVRDLIVLEGINDLGGLDRTEPHSQQIHDALVDRLEDALRQIVEQAHTHGIRVFGGTLTPDGGSDYYHPDERSEADRQRLNQWIRSSRVFDGVIDFDAALRDPAHPDRLSPAYDSGDHLHPSPAGYNVMGNAVPLALFPHGPARTGANH